MTSVSVADVYYYAVVFITLFILTDVSDVYDLIFYYYLTIFVL